MTPPHFSTAIYTTPFDGSATPVLGLPNIGSTPTRTELTVPASITGQRRLDLHALQVLVGPSFTWESGPKWRWGIQTGIALGIGASQLRFNEQITVADAATPTINQSGRTDDLHAWAGWFTAACASGTA